MPAAKSAHPFRLFIRLYRQITGRPVLIASAALGLAAWWGLYALWPMSKLSTRGVVAWDLGTLVYLISVFFHMSNHAPEKIRLRAAKLHEGAGMVLFAAMLFAVLALGVVGLEMQLAKADHGWMKSGHVALAALSVALTWMFVQVMFALHYAHEFYGAGPVGQERGGLNFPGGEAPDYWDFLHFSVVIGLTAQTADIEITTKPIRRLVTAHGIIAFVFNTVILAFTINMAASLL